MIKLINDTINKEDIKSLCEWLLQDEIPRLTKGWNQNGLKKLVQSIPFTLIQVLPQYFYHWQHYNIPIV